LSMKRDLVTEAALDGPEFHEYFVNYFPERLRPAIKDHGDAHPLRRDIVATEVVNKVVAAAGPSFVHRLREPTGASTLDAVRGFRIVTELFGVDGIKRSLDTAELSVERADEVRLRIRLLVDRCAAVLVSRRRLDLHIEGRRLKTALQQINAV